MAEGGREARSVGSRPDRAWHLAMVIVVVALGMGPSRAEAAPSPPGQTESVSVAILPSAVSLAAGDHAVLTVVVTNAAAEEATVSGLEVEAPSTVTVEANAPFAPTAIAPGGRSVHRYTVTAGRTPGTVTVTAIVNVSGGGPAGPGVTERPVAASTDVSIVSTEPTLEATIVSAPTSVRDGETGERLTILVRNPSSYQLDNVTLDLIGSTDITLTPLRADDAQASCADPSTPAAIEGSLAPGTAMTIDLCILVDDIVRIGKQTVGVFAHGTFDTPSMEVAATSSATTIVEVNVFGTTAIGSLGGVSLFLFPAIIPVVVFLGLSRVAYPRTSWLPSKVEVTELSWAVPLIVLAAVFYAGYWLTTGVDLTIQTSTQAIVVLFALGLGLGVFSWALFAIGYHFRTGRKRFRLGDEPEKVLKRLNWNGTPLKVQTVTGAVPFRYRLGLGPDGRTATCSQIEYEVKEGVDGQAFHDAVTESDAGAAVKELSSVTLSWSGAQVQLVDNVALDAATSDVIAEKETVT